jgi:hypothetical protein
VTAHALAKGWQRIRDVSRVPAERARAVAWAMAPGLTLHYSEDEAAPVSYVFVRSETAGVATGVSGRCGSR